MSKRPRQVSKPKTIFKNKYINLYSIIANFDEGKREYFVSDRGERCGVIIINNQSILLVRQYRYLINDLSWEIPGGGVGENEDPLTAGRREVFEEAGIECTALEPFFLYQQGVDTTFNPTHLFVTKKFTVKEGIFNSETDKRQWFKVSAALDMVIDGTIKDSMTILAILLYKIRNIDNY
jgi:8-oxo-dGTP pyrophosphatase MutT (NUDIX family)|tara:strand:+ start:175 stop:711 length:537 start_codon:yes stop_codon:yes gene_type:complete